MEGETLDFHAEMHRLTVQILGATVLDEGVRRDDQVIIEATDAHVDGRTSGRPGEFLLD